MKKMIIPALLSFVCTSLLQAQPVKIIPGFTGYAVPAENSSEDDESELFSEKDGLHHWGLVPGQTVEYHFQLKKSGSLSIGAEIINPAAVIEMELAGQKKKVWLNANKKMKLVSLGSFNITTPGNYFIKLSCGKLSGTGINIRSLQIGGPASAEMQFNTKPRRNAASVHLFYPIPDTLKAINFYNEVTVPAGFDHMHSYYMACGFSRGYFGMQVNSEKERRIIFSVWDAGNEATDRNKVADENKVQLLAKGEDVFADGFGNEGTGGHSHWIYNWNTGSSYRFLVTALPDSASNTTIYTGYFFIPEKQQWKLIASFRAPKDGKYLSHLYSFNENFWGTNGQLQRKALFGNQWIRKESGDWVELTEASFSMDATGKAGDRKDVGAGVQDKQFYLWNGGFENADAKFGEHFKRAAAGIKPVVDLYRNADSSIQTEKEKEIIFKAIKEGKIDTTGSVNGVYYQLLKEGTGRNVKVTDTVVAFYKGSILNGEVFDQTNTEPATFPLSRLIKGWQIALPACKVGGKIRLIIPSALAYSIRSRSSKIPPNSILVFDIEVLSVK